MTKRTIPDSTSAVVRCLTTARDAWKKTAVAADRGIGVEHWAELNDAEPTSLLNRLLREVHDVEIALAAEMSATAQLVEMADKLATHVSHFHQVLDLGIARGTFKAGTRSYYGRDINSTRRPDLSSYEAIRDAAQHIVDGEAARDIIEDNLFVPMALPSAADVCGLLAVFKGLRAQSKATKIATDAARADLAALYPEAQALAEDICDTVKDFYRQDLTPRAAA
jgi:hypothetical protein